MYLGSLPATERQRLLSNLFSFDLPCVFLAKYAEENADRLNLDGEEHDDDHDLQAYRQIHDALQHPGIPLL